jgi:hypothetical protein
MSRIHDTFRRTLIDLAADQVWAELSDDERARLRRQFQTVTAAETSTRSLIRKGLLDGGHPTRDATTVLDSIQSRFTPQPSQGT